MPALSIRQEVKDMPKSERETLLTELLAVQVGVGEDMSVHETRILVSIGQGIFWSKPYHIMAKALAEAVEAEFETIPTGGE